MPIGLNDPAEAIRFLQRQGYLLVKQDGPLTRPVISYSADSLSRDWENGEAERNGWVRAEFGMCCFDTMRDNKHEQYCSYRN